MYLVYQSRFCIIEILGNRDLKKMYIHYFCSKCNLFNEFICNILIYFYIPFADVLSTIFRTICVTRLLYSISCLRDRLLKFKKRLSISDE